MKINSRKIFLYVLALAVIIALSGAPVFAASDPCNGFHAQINPGGQTVLETLTTITATGGVNKNEATDISCAWSQAANDSIHVAFVPSQCVLSFATPQVGPSGVDLHFTLSVSANYNGARCSESKPTTITIQNVNQAPTASATATPATVNEGETVTLNGSASSDPDGNPLSYTWTQTVGTHVTINNANSAIATFAAPAEQYPNGENLTFVLTVSDGSLSGTATVYVIVNSVNQPPIAVISQACPIAVNEGATVTLDGSGSSDPDLGLLEYQWNQVHGIPNADLTGVDLTQPSISFKAPYLIGNLDTMKFGLTVTDNGSLTGSAECDIQVLDKTAPEISGAENITIGATGPSGTAVTFNVTANDAVDGDVPVTCDPTSGSTFPLGSTTVNCSASDKAGNTANASFTVTVQDTTPPVITPVISGTSGANGWYISDVNVSWTVSDPESNITVSTGCDATTISTDTAGTTLTCSATSAGGTSSQSVTIKRDATPPTAALSVTAGTAGTNGWYTSNVTVHTAGTDSVSSPVTCTADQNQTAETAGTVFNGSCTNDAGLKTDAAPLTIKLDKTGPTATLSVTAGKAGNNGWYTSDVTVHTAGTDSISSPVTCTADQSQTAETAGTVFNGSCTNDAGLKTDATSLTIKLDKTPPTGVSGAPNRNADYNGWYNHAVDVVFTGTDSLSGIDSCTTVSYNGPDSATASVSGTCTDKAGNTSASVASISFKYDATPPTAALSVTAGTAGAKGWYTSNVTVHTSGADSVSPVTCTPDQLQTAETSGTVFNGSCTNDAGLTTNATSLTIKLDKTGPTATLLVTAGTAGNNGWYTSDVTVHTAGADSISGPVTCTADQSQTAETAGTVFNGSCTNDAGLKTDATSLTIKLDKTAPTDITFNGMSDKASYYFGFVPPAPTCSATDNVSGLDSCVVTGYSTNLGYHELTATAKDKAGNESTATLGYTVLAWTLSGFYQPVDMGGVWNTVKGGATVPLKFQVFAGPTELTDVAVIDKFLVKGVTCPSASAPTDDIEFTTTGGTTLRYDTTAHQFIQNWQTPRNAGACYQVTMTTDDGTSLSALFKLK